MPLFSRIRSQAYLNFILKLYHATPVTGFGHLHGAKTNRYVHIGTVDAPVTVAEVTEALEECRAHGYRALDVLGWEWEMGLYEPIKDLGQQYGIDVRCLQIPREVMEKPAVEAGDVRFFEMAYAQVDVEVSGRTVAVHLTDFAMPNTELIPPEVRERIEGWSDYVDYWAVDFDHQNDTFHNQWQSFRTRKRPKLETSSAPHAYEQPGVYQIIVKVIDIFGNDTTKPLRVEVP